MSKYSRTYALDKGDTLETLSKKFHLAPNDIKKYHNTYCHVKKAIFFDIPETLTEVILPPIGIEISNGKLINFDHKQEITFVGHKNELLDIKSLNHTYGVIINRKRIGKVPLKLHYKINITYLEEIQQGLYVIELNRAQVYINNRAPELLAEQLADDCGKVMYPIQVIISKAGEIVGLNNALEIKERWHIKRLKIENYYRSSIVKTIVAKMDDAYSNTVVLLKALKDDLFVNLLFSHIYRTHENYRSNYEKKMCISPFGRRYTYKLSSELEPFLSITKKVALRVKGTAEEIDVKSKFDIHYTLEAPGHTVFSIQGGIKTICRGKEEDIEFQAHHIDFQAID